MQSRDIAEALAYPQIVDTLDINHPLQLLIHVVLNAIQVLNLLDSHRLVATYAQILREAVIPVVILGLLPVAIVRHREVVLPLLLQDPVVREARLEEALPTGAVLLVVHEEVEAVAMAVDQGKNGHLHELPDKRIYTLD